MQMVGGMATLRSLDAGASMTASFEEKLDGQL